jgi:hypothetical protein
MTFPIEGIAVATIASKAVRANKTEGLILYISSSFIVWFNNASEVADREDETTRKRITC